MDDAAEGAVGAAAACAMLESIRVPVSAAAEIRADANLEAVGISTPAMIAHPCPCHPKAIDVICRARSWNQICFAART